VNLSGRASTTADLPPRRLATNRPTKGEDGFTLIELLITTLVVPIVVGGLGLALVSVFSLQSGVSNRISDSGDAQVLAASFGKDVQSAQLLTTKSASTGPAPCGSSSQVLGLEWGIGQVGVTQTEVSYVSVNGTLVRNVCQGGNTTTPTETSVVSHDVPSSVSCPTPTAAGGQCTTVTPTAAATLATAGWTPTPGVSGVNVSILEPNSGYSFGLVGVPRDWTPASGGLPGGGLPLLPLELLGGTGSCANTAVLNLSGGSNINVGSGSGIVGVSSLCANSIQVTGGSNLNASSVVTADPSLNSVDVVTNSGSSGPSGTAAETYQSVLTDPLSSLVPPTNPTTALAGSCAVLVAYQSYSCSPGNYSSLSVSGGFTGGASIAFGAGTYVFTNAVSIANNNSVTFGSGTYWFQGGLTIGGGITATFGKGTYIFGTTTTGSGNALSVANGTTVNGSSGVLFYAQGGVVNMTGGAVTSLTGLSQYDNVAIWDAGASGTANPLQLSGGSSSTVISGGIYVPSGQITISGSNPTTMLFIVTSLLSQTGGTTVNVG
jgi:type II secretory pathway pseudopilin PulG